MKRYHWKYSLILIIVIFIGLMIKPSEVTGEVKPIEDAKAEIQGISEEEQQTLEELFTLSQEIEEMEREELRISEEINELMVGIDKLDESIFKEQESYDSLLDIMEQVLISYQRGGPASYLDIILKTKDLTSFIKSLNLIKDISRNTGELLASIEESKESLMKKRQILQDNKVLLENKKNDLEKAIEARHRLVKEQEAYLESLAEEKEKYQTHLENLQLMWANVKDLFSGIVDEFSRIIGEGHFTLEDLNLKFNFISIKGAIHEETFNRIIKDNSTLSEIIFHFGDEEVVIEVPDSSLVLKGDFVLQDSSTLLFVPESGSFYGMALEPESINELFRMGPLLIDLEQVAGDMVLIDIELDHVDTEEGFLVFTIDTGFLF